MFSWALAILAGTIITVTMLLILKLMRICIAKLKMIGKKLFLKYKKRDWDNKKE